MLLHNSTLYNFIENIEAERKYALSKPIYLGLDVK